MEYSPDLPLDVARLIFEAAAWSDWSTAHSLTLVSKDVRQWIDPVLHHTVALDTFTHLHAFAASIIARNDPEFFRRTVKKLTVGTLDSTEYPQESTENNESLLVILAACTGVERFAFWIAAPLRIVPLLQLQDRAQPTHVSFGVVTRGTPLILLGTMLSPFLTHLHLDFTSYGTSLTAYNSVDLWPLLFEMCSGLTHLQFSGTALETLKPEDLHPTIDPIVYTLPQTTRLIVNAISLRAHANGTRIPCTLKTLQADPRVVFILPKTHALEPVEELRPYETDRDGSLDWGSHKDIDWENLPVDILI